MLDVSPLCVIGYFFHRMLDWLFFSQNPLITFSRLNFSNSFSLCLSASLSPLSLVLSLFLSFFLLLHIYGRFCQCFDRNDFFIILICMICINIVPEKIFFLSKRKKTPNLVPYRFYNFPININLTFQGIIFTNKTL